MKILFLTQYYPPEMGAPAARVSELAKRWVDAGSDITVVTAFPNHPTGHVFPGYRRRACLREVIEGVTVLRSWIYVTPNQGFFRRVLCFLSFMVSATMNALLRSPPCDVVIATSPQIFCGLAGWMVSLLKRKPFVLEVRDLWPESAIQLGVLKNPLLIRISRGLEKFLYERADLIVPVSSSIQEAIGDQGIPPDRMKMIPNGIDPKLFRPRERENSKRDKLRLNDKFIVSYIGTHGISHGLERLLEAANELKERSEIHFLLIGEGAQKEELVQRARTLSLENVDFLPIQPKQEIPEWLAASDVSVVSLMDLPVFATVLPSKMFEIMACERPVLLLGRGECARLINEADAGVVVESGEPNDVASAVMDLAASQEKCGRLGRSGRRYVLEHFNRDDLAREYLRRLEETFGP